MLKIKNKVGIDSNGTRSCCIDLLCLLWRWTYTHGRKYEPVEATVVQLPVAVAVFIAIRSGEGLEAVANLIPLRRLPQLHWSIKFALSMCVYQQGYIFSY